MNPTEKQIEMKNKQIYEEPTFEILCFQTSDIITTSGGSSGEDDNLGEWDPQSFEFE